jgi:hypothetical protein
VARAKGASPAGGSTPSRARKVGQEQRRPFSRTSHWNQYAVSDGRTARGTVKLTAGAFVAIDTDGSTIGTFGSLREAVRAFGGGER